MASEGDIGETPSLISRWISVVLYIQYYLLFCRRVIASYLFTLLSLYVRNTADVVLVHAVFVGQPSRRGRV